jgi:arylsulfatase
LDEEELAVGSRRFDEDRWELFDLATDFSEAIDRAGDEPERLHQLTELWASEAGRNNVLPISDGLVDRFSGFIPPAWPAGTVRTYRPGGGPVSDESVPMLWGGFHMTAEFETHAPAHGVVFALGDWFGGYALYAVEGILYFTFARSADALELATPSALPPGRHEAGIEYALGAAGEAGRMVLFLDGARVDATSVDGALPMALQHGGAGLRLGRDTGFPVSSRYSNPATFNGSVNQVTIAAPGSRRPDRADEVRAALHAD